jgi:hypothetical protein
MYKDVAASVKTRESNSEKGREYWGAAASRSKIATLLRSLQLYVSLSVNTRLVQIMYSLN